MELLKGFLTGLVLSIPFGPVGIYCMELTVTEGRWKGYVTALGMVTIDVVFSLLALFFVTSADDFIIKYNLPLKMLIGILLMCLAYKKLKRKISIKDIDVHFESMIQNYFIGIGFALANISTIATITFMFSLLQVYENNSPFLVFELALGVFMGGASLWFLTTYLIVKFKRFTRKETLIKFVRYTNLLIFLFGSILVVSAFLGISKL